MGKSGSISKIESERRYREKATNYKYPRCCGEQMKRIYERDFRGGVQKMYPIGWRCRVCKKLQSD